MMAMLRILSLFLLLVPTVALADINDPSSCPSQTVNGTLVFTCNDSVTIPNGTSYNVTQDIGLIIEGDLTLGNGASITLDSAQSSFFVQLNDGGSLNLQQNAVFEGDVAQAESINLGYTTRLEGNINASDDVTLEQNSQVTGNVITQGDVDIKNGASVGGFVDSQGKVTLEQNARVDGSVTSADGVDIKYGAQVGGTVTSDGDVTLEQNAVVAGSIDSGGDVDLKYGAQVQGDVVTEGDLTLEQNAQGNGSVDADGDVELKYGARIDGNINSRGDVELEQNAYVGGYVNSPNADELDSNQVGGETCNQGGNFGPCGSGGGPTSLLGDWHFDDSGWNGTAGEVIDSSGNDYHGTAQGDTDTSGVSPAIGGSPGTCRYGELAKSGYVELPNLDPLADSDNISVSFWFKGDGQQQDPSNSGEEFQTLMVLGESSTLQSNGRFEVFRSVARGSINVEIRMANGDLHSVEYGDISEGQPQLFDNEWHHMAASYDRSERELSLFIDGAEVAVEDFNGNRNLNTIGNNPSLYVGALTGGNNGFVGSIDEVTASTSVYSAGDVNQLFNRTRTCPSQPALAQCSAVWPTSFTQSGNNAPQPFTLPSDSNQSPLPEQLQPIDYLRVGNFSDVGQNYQTNGTTSRLYIDGNLTIQSGRRLNVNGNANELIIVVTGDLTLQRDVRINGYIYVAGNFTYYHANNSSNRIVIEGGVSVQGGSQALDSNRQYGPAITYSAPEPPLAGGQFCAAQPAQPPEPVLNWRLNAGPWSGAAGEVIDSSSNGLNGRSVNGASYQPADSGSAIVADANGFGTCGYGYLEAANQQYFEIADQTVLDFADEFTVGVWVKPTSLPGSGLMTLFSKNENYEVHLRPDGRINWWWQTSSGQVRQLDSTAAVQVGEWSYVAVRYRDNEQTLFIDGVAVGTENYSGGLRQNNMPLQLGSDQNFAGRYFNGYLDELSLFDQALSAQQIQQVQQQTTLCGGATPQCYSSALESDEIFGQEWSRTAVSGSFLPQIVGGRARLTENQDNQSTAITLNGSFPAEDNLVELEFKLYAYGGDGADGIAVVFSDASEQAIPGSEGGSLGYAQRNNGDAGFNGGWLGIGFDEFGNFSLAKEGRVGGYSGSLRPNRVVLRGAEQTNYDYLVDSGTLSPGIDTNSATAGPGHLYRIRIDSRTAGESLVSVERDINDGNGYQPVIPPFNIYDSQYGQQPYVPENFTISLTGSTGTNSNIHEFDDIQICAEKGTFGTADINHYRIDAPANALTCAGAEIVVRACTDSDCNNQYGQPSSAELSLATGADSWSQNPFTFTGTQTVELQKYQAGAYALEFEGGSPNAPARCFIDGVESTSCEIAFADTGLVFTQSADLNNTDIAKQTAGVPLTDLQLSLVELDSSTLQCQAKAAQLSDITLTRECVNPASCVNPVDYNQAEMTATTGAGSVALPYDGNDAVLPVAFVGGSESLTIDYGDVGEVRLTAAATLPNGKTVSGVSESFVWQPAKLALTMTNPAGAFDNGIFARAGNAVSAEIKALNANDQVTPNFGNEATTERLRLNSSVTVPPSGETAGTLMGADSFPDPTNGVTTSSTVAYAEVGAPTFTAKIASDDYISGVHPAQTTPVATATPGRYIPHHFTISNAGFSSSSCESGEGYFYIGQAQPLNVAMELQAVNANGTITANYDDALAYVQSNAGLEFWPFNSDSGSPPQPSSGAVSANAVALTWTAGVGSFSLSAVPSVTYKRDDESPEGPYLQYQLGVQYNDDEFNNYYSLIDTSGSALSGNGAPRNYYPINNAPKKLLFGHMTLTNLFGPSTDPLSVEGQVEYWNGAQFAIDDSNSCSEFNVADFSDDVSSEDYDEVDIRPAGATQRLTGGRLFDVSETLINQLYWSNTNAATEGVNSFLFDLEVPEFLQTDVDGDGVFNENPQAEAVFGIYQGSDRQIYWQEVGW